MTSKLFVAINEVIAFGWECVRGQVLHGICSMTDTSQTWHIIQNKNYALAHLSMWCINTYLSILLYWHWGYNTDGWMQEKCNTRARFLSLAWSKLRLCLANHRAGYFSNLTCDWLSIVWAYSEQEAEIGPSALAMELHLSYAPITPVRALVPILDFV